MFKFGDIQTMLFNIGDMIATMFEFLVDYFEDVAYFVRLLGAFVVNIPNYLMHFLPASLIAVVALAIGIIVTLRVVGRK